MLGKPNKTFGKKRSSLWPHVRRGFLKSHGVCEACGSTRKLEVHHVQPFHLRPDLELDPSNLITLCEAKDRDCHLRLGHLLSWQSYNVSVRADAAHFRQEVESRP